MKKKFYSFLAITLLCAVFASSCRRKAGPLSCAASTVDYTQELSQYLSNQSKGNCERLVKSIEDLYQSCTTPGSFDREELEDIENDLDCDNL